MYSFRGRYSLSLHDLIVGVRTLYSVYVHCTVYLIFIFVYTIYVKDISHFCFMIFIFFCYFAKTGKFFVAIVKFKHSAISLWKKLSSVKYSRD